MVSIKNLFAKLFVFPSKSELDPKQVILGGLVLLSWVAVTLAIIYAGLHSHLAFADATGTGIALPGGTGGEDDTGKLTAAATLLRILDTGIFKWGARLFAGLCIMSAAWALKEQRFGVAVICIVGAIIFGTAPKWVANLFAIGGNQGIFGDNSEIIHMKDREVKRYG